MLSAETLKEYAEVRARVWRLERDGVLVEEITLSPHMTLESLLEKREIAAREGPPPSPLDVKVADIESRLAALEAKEATSVSLTRT